MCDCVPENEKRELSPITLTLFERCEQPFAPGKDFENLRDEGKKNEIEIIQFPDSCTCTANDFCCVLDPSSEETSSGSSRTYKFVDLRNCECPGEVEEVEPSVKEEEEEEEDKKEKERTDEPDIECTLAIIKPEAMVFREKIERRMFEEGFAIYQTRWLRLSPEQAAEFYADTYSQLCFPRLVTYMSSTPITVYVLAKRNAVNEWRHIMGPTSVADARIYYPDSVRSLYGRRGDDVRNAVHGSSSREKAEKEIHFFFPEFIIEPLMKNESAVDYLVKVINPVLTTGLAMCCQCKPDDPIRFLANWLILNNPNKPKLPHDLALTPT